MLGVYDYTVILTYMSLMVSVGGILFSVNGHLNLAVLCLAVSGLLDMFDGKVARTKKNRTEVEKKFGIQIDSLSDIVCFGVGPAVICYCMGMKGVTGILILLFYVTAGLIRLAWFNVSEEIRQNETEEKRKCYQGLPITSMAIALPLLVVFRPLLGKREFMLSLHALVLIVGLLFITNFKLKKPGNLVISGLVIVVAAAVLHILHIW
ncbi:MULTISPECIES: CDP-alcohol phosphatidyltransferase family protein [unclassified Candidatus Paralachnospira]|uniref:CDP-alcohol phosphatidyltransferase family protein n=1 Tax=unclassified Candidatus Paralachnospira TaxID=3099471 RepID=UPI003F907FD7